MILPDAATDRTVTTSTSLDASQGASCPLVLNDIMNAATTPGGYEIADAETHLVVYKVTNESITDPYLGPVPADLKDEQDDFATQEKIWEYFAALIPQQHREMISEYLVLTDGEDNILAAVAQTHEDPTRWKLEVDITDSADFPNLTFTMMHEFGHLLTLNANQVQPSMEVFKNPSDDVIRNHEASICPNYFPGEGCSQSNSYINQFYQRFWTNIYTEWNEIDQIDNQAVYYKRLTEFYEKHEDQFVSDYAVTNPAEDIAETWTHFVFTPKPEGDTIADQKVLFFYEYPELVNLREEILSRLCTAYPTLAD